MPTIDALKGSVTTPKPLHLVTFAFADGTYLRVATHAVTYGGNAYLGRIVNSNLGALQQLSQDGLDVVPNVSITLADADKAMYSYADKFYGARMTVDFVLYDIAAGTYSSDSFRVFTGRCGKPECSDLTLEVSATFVLQLGSRKLPTFPIQQRCPKIQPTNTAEFAAAFNPESIFWPCGLTAGNYTGPCNYTREGCQANNNLLRFAGIQYNVPDAGVTREYVSGQKVDLRSNQNTAKYGDYVPIVLGTAWVDAVVTNSAPEANSTRGEAIIAEGVSNILKAVCNDEQLPAATDLYGNPYIVANALFRYNVLNNGARDGRLNQDAFYSGRGDPYGSMAAIEWCVPRKVGGDSGVPRVRALVTGKPVRVYSDASTYTEAASTSFAWNILYVLSRAGLAYADVDIASFVNAAAYFAENVTYTDQYGNVTTHQRYVCSMVVRQRTTAADVIAGLLRGCNSILRWNSSTGKVQIVPKATLADQQPTMPAGSNYATGVASTHANGTFATGNVAYRFTTANITKRDSGEWNIRRLARGITDTPNAVAFQFTNSERDYVSDSISTVDSDAVNAAGQQVDASIKVDGIATLDQAKRVSNTFLSEIQADQWELETDFGALKVATGHIVMVDVAKYGLTQQLMRVLKAQPSQNSETIKFTLAVHSDAWYTDRNSIDSRRKDIRRNRLARPAYAWAPYEEQPVAGDALYSRTDWSFAIQPTILDQFGNSKQVLTITGKMPVNNPAGTLPPPVVRKQGTQGSAGTGALAGGGRPYYFCLTAVDAEGAEGAPSDLCEVVIAGAGSTYSANIPVVGYDPDTSYFRLYGYGSTVGMTWIQNVDIADPVVVTEWAENTYGCPDGEWYGTIMRMRRVQHGGVAGQKVTEVGTGTMTLPGAGTGGYSWTGADIMLVAQADSSVLPIANFRCTGNTGDVLSVTPDPSGIVAVDDVVVICSAPTVSGSVLTDVRWKNPLSNGGYGLAPGAERRKIWRWIAGAGRGESYLIKNNTADTITIYGTFRTPPDSTSRGIVEEPDDLPECADVYGIDNSDPAAQFSATIPTDNYSAVMVRIEGVAYDGGYNESPSHANPERLIWLLGDWNAGSSTQQFVTISTDSTIA